MNETVKVNSRLQKFTYPLFVIFAFVVLAAVGYAQTSAIPAPNIIWLTENTPGVMALRWERVGEKDTRILGWHIYRDGSRHAWVAEGNNFTNDWTETLVSGDNLAHQYFVKADAGAITEALSSITVTRTVAATTATITTTTTPPAPPTNFTAGTPTSTTTPLSWTASLNADKYNISRQVPGSASWIVVVQVTTGTSYTDTGLTPATTYSYRIDACLSGTGCSTTYTYLNNVTTASATTATTLSAPTNLTVTFLATGGQFAPNPSVKLTWQPVTGADQYKLFSRPQGGTTWMLRASLPGNFTSGEIDAGNMSGTYDFKVQACNVAAQQCSGDSNIMVTTIPGSATTAASGLTVASSSISKNPLTAGEMQIAKATIHSATSFSNLNVEIRIYNSSDTMVGSQKFPGVNFAAGTASSFQFNYLSSATLNPGTYTVGVGVWSSTYSINYLASPLHSFTVVAPDTTNPTATTTTTTKILVTPTVEKGTTFCDSSTGIRSTTIIFKANPTSGAYFKIMRNGVYFGTKEPGTYTFSNAIWRWEAIAKPGFMFDHVPTNEFILNQQCDSAAPPTASPTPPPPTPLPQPQPPTTTAPTPPPTILPVTNTTNTSNLTISSPAILEPVAAVTTVEQYSSYCADPRNHAECQTYATEKIIVATQPGSTAGEAPVVNEDVTKVLAQRLGVRMFQDTDSDGIIDYDEVNIYGTNPKNADTNGDGGSDGDQLLMGTDPLAQKVAPTALGDASTMEMETSYTNPNAIVYENPKLLGEKRTHLLAIKNVEGRIKTNPETSATSTTLVLTGVALPNSFVTLYIFSEPIVVRVKADASGAWVYTLDQELPDGSHEVVSAITDTGGRILAKSEAAPFIKTAAAVSFGTVDLLPSQAAPSFFSGTYFYLFVALFIALLLVAFAVIGMMVKQKGAREGDGGMAL